jgi:hypothetical protein
LLLTTPWATLAPSAKPAEDFCVAGWTAMHPTTHRLGELFAQQGPFF